MQTHIRCPFLSSYQGVSSRCLVCKHGSHVTGIPKADWPGVKNKQLTAMPCSVLVDNQWWIIYLLYLSVRMTVTKYARGMLCLLWTVYAQFAFDKSCDLVFWPYDLRINACPVPACLSTEFAVDSSSLFLFTAQTNTQTRLTQPCISLGLFNRVPALIGWGKGGNVTSAGWQVTRCDPIWHTSFRSGACSTNCYTLPYLTLQTGGQKTYRCSWLL